MLGVLAALWLVAQQPDSLAVRRAARAAQDRFERYRVAHLPRSVGSPARACDEIVGRFCFWHDDDEDEWRPPPEPPRIGVARRALIATLDSVARRIPGDGWVAGQRVRYLVEAGEQEAALRAALDCQADRWWCRALAGYAYHAEQRYDSADAAFDAALRDMPAEDRCAWTDVSLLLESLPEGYRKASCEERTAMERTIWWLADPLYLVPGNERRSEHYARHVLDRLQHTARSPYGVRWGDDLRELLVRYGWPIAWTRDDTRSAALATSPSVMSHHEPKGRRFLPSGRFWLDSLATTVATWDLDPDRPRSSYAPAYVESVEDLDPHVAVFRRGDSAVVVAGFDLTVGERPSPTRSGDVEAALVFTPDEHAAPVVARKRGSSLRDVLALIAPRPAGLLSVEVLLRSDSGYARRDRQWLALAPLDGQIGLSDPLLLLIRDEDSLPASLEEAIPHAQRSNRVPSGERLGLFWEIYNLERQAGGVTLSITVVREGAGLLRRAAEWAGLASRRRPSVSLSWVEPPASQRVRPRALVISVPETSPGTHVLEITARTADGGTATARQVLMIQELPKRQK